MRDDARAGFAGLSAHGVQPGPLTQLVSRLATSLRRSRAPNVPRIAIFSAGAVWGGVVVKRDGDGFRG